MGRRYQPVFVVCATYEIVAPDPVTALLTVREHLAGTDVREIEVTKVVYRDPAPTPAIVAPGIAYPAAVLDKNNGKVIQSHHEPIDVTPSL